MSFLDKAKSKATQLSQQAKEKFDDYKENKKVDDLLDDLGRITYRQHTGRGEDGDTEEIAALVEQLKVLEAEGADVLPRPPADESDSADGTDAPASNLPPPTAPPTV
jgi:hypothetical protein